MDQECRTRSFPRVWRAARRAFPAVVRAAQRALSAERARAAVSGVCRCARGGARGAQQALQPTVVLSPALGGIVIGQEVGRALGVRAIFAERQEGKLTCAAASRSMPTIACSSSRTSSRRAVDAGNDAAAEALGALVTGAAAIVDRGRTPRDRICRCRRSSAWTCRRIQPEACPLCAKGVPVVKPGSRAS